MGISHSENENKKQKLRKGGRGKWWADRTWLYRERERRKYRDKNKYNIT